jgi:transposase
MFVDFSGGTLWYADPATGEEREAELFVAVLGGSSLTYVEPAPDQKLATWVACHVRALEYFGGAPRGFVPDNLRSAVTKADRYEPLVNRTYAQLARHYDAVVLPARAHRPRDKAKAEAAVKLASRWIIAKLRNEQFRGFGVLREAIRPLVDKLNDKPMRALGLSRRQIFEASERAALGPLPQHRYEWCEWGRDFVNSDYHVAFDRHFYSVPHELGGQTLDIRATATTVEILDGTRRVASHVRSREVGGKTTLVDHMPAAHRAHAEWTPERLRSWAATTGPSCAGFVDALLADKPHPEHGYRACVGLVHLARRYAADRVDAACARALRVGALSLRSVRSILANDLDRVLPEPDKAALPSHENVRGPDYYD